MHYASRGSITEITLLLILGIFVTVALNDNASNTISHSQLPSLFVIILHAEAISSIQSKYFPIVATNNYTTTKK